MPPDRSVSKISLILALLFSFHIVPDTLCAESRYRMQQVADGVYAALQPTAERFNDCNSAILISDRDVIVVDSQSSPERAREVLAEIRKLTDKPVRYVINTHWHGDHTQGNQVYVDAFPTVDIIGHSTHLEDVPGRAEPAHQEQLGRYEASLANAETELKTGAKADGTALTDDEKAALPSRMERNRRRYEDLQKVSFALPTVTVHDKTVLHRGQRRMEILPFKAHTRGDLVIYLPEEKVLITGDLLDDLPFGGHGYPSSWIHTLDTLAKLQFDHVISGHGRVLKGKEHLLRVRDFLRAVVSQAKAGVEADKTLEQVTESVDVSAARRDLAGDDAAAQRAFDDWLPELVKRAFLEAQGGL